MKIQRTYPQPDSPAENIGARERAMAVFKYLLDLEPGDAVRHPRFDLIRHAFEQHGRAGIKAWNAIPGNFNTYPTLDESYCEPLTSSQEVGPAQVKPFVKDGL